MQMNMNRSLLKCQSTVLETVALTIISTVMLVSRRVNADGSPWIPAKHAVLCGAHFISGKTKKIVIYFVNAGKIDKVSPKNFLI